MANRHRGEIEAELGGNTYTLVLTLVFRPIYRIPIFRSM